MIRHFRVSFFVVDEMVSKDFLRVFGAEIDKIMKLLSRIRRRIIVE